MTKLITLSLTQEALDFLNIISIYKKESKRSLLHQMIEASDRPKPYHLPHQPQAKPRLKVEFEPWAAEYLEQAQSFSSQNMEVERLIRLERDRLRQNCDRYIDRLETLTDRIDKLTWFRAGNNEAQDLALNKAIELFQQEIDLIQALLGNDCEVLLYGDALVG